MLQRLVVIGPSPWQFMILYKVCVWNETLPLCGLPQEVKYEQMVTFFTVLLRGSNSIHPIQTAAPGLDKRPSLGWLRTAGRPWVPDSCSGCAAPALSRSRSLSVSVIKWHCFIGVTLPPFSFSVCVCMCVWAGLDRLSVSPFCYFVCSTLAACQLGRDLGIWSAVLFAVEFKTTKFTLWLVKSFARRRMSTYCLYNCIIKMLAKRFALKF